MNEATTLDCLILLLSTLALAQQHPHKKAAKAAPAARPKAGSALTIHQSALIVDTHADTPQRFLDENFDLGENTPVSAGHIDFDKIKQGNLGAEFSPSGLSPSSRATTPNAPWT